MKKKARDIRVGDKIVLPRQRIEVTVTGIAPGVWGADKGVIVSWGDSGTEINVDEMVTYFPDP